MSRLSCTALLLLWGSELLGQAPAYLLRVDHGAAKDGILELEGVSGTQTGSVLVGVELDVPTGAAGVNSWSLGLSHDPNVLTVVSATVAGTAAESALSAAVTVGPDGVVSTVTLDADHAVLLPGEATSLLLLVEYGGVFPAKDTTVQTRLRLVDGLPGPGGPVTTSLKTWDGAAESTVSPQRQNLIVLLSGFEYSTLFDLSLDLPGAIPGAGDSRFVGYVSPGVKPLYDVRVILDSRLPGTSATGAQGWSLSVAHDPGVFRIASVTTAGTDAGEAIEGGFERHETLDNASGHGLISAVVLSFTQPISLPPLGRSELLAVRYELLADTSVEGTQIDSAIRFQDKLQGQGQPVNNVVTLGGASNRPAVQRGIVFDLTVGTPPFQPFVRSDANDDGRLNIADAVWIVSELYAGGPATSCQYAADVNADGRKDLSDVSFLIRYQFLGTRPPPAPFPTCGVQGDQLPDLCPIGSTRC